MQCHSYLPVYQSHYELNVDTSGGSRPMYNGSGAFRSGHHDNQVPTLPVPQANFIHKELLRQTMVMHEVTFRDQVHELHRLYRRQRELMTEIKSKELSINHRQLEVRSSNSSSTMLFSSVQSNLHSVPFLSSQYMPSSVNTDYHQRASYSIKVTTSDTHVISLNEAPVDTFPVSKGKKIGGKLLDLELPAETYIDIDEWESLGNEQYVDGRTSASLPLSKPSEFIVEADGVASTINIKLDPVLKKEVSSPSIDQGSDNNFSDTNEPPATIFSEKTHKLPDMGGTPDMSEKKSALLIQALPFFNNHSRSSKKADLYSKSKGYVEKGFDDGSRCSPSFGTPASIQSSSPRPKLESLACMSSVTSNHLKFVNGSCSIDLNSTIFDPSSGKPLTDIVPEDRYESSKHIFGSSEVSSPCENMKKCKRIRVIDINLPCDPATDDEPFAEDFLAGHDYRRTNPIDLNICMLDDRLPTKSYSLDKNSVEIDLEAPASPEVEECTPPRGDTLGERVLIAAEAIVSMSYKKTLLFPETEISDCGGLEWFAEFVYSFSTELDNDTGTMRLNEIDDFEAMTLKLAEMKSEDYFSRNSVEISSQTCSMLITSKTRKGRMKRSKKKDFQREVLPALSSLSRVEVTEDLQILEGLMEAAGTPWQLRTRRGRRMGKKPLVIKKKLLSTNITEVKDGFVFSWGRDNRRPRGNRKPVSLAVVMSRSWF